jgi:hypothetical protein
MQALTIHHVRNAMVLAIVHALTSPVFAAQIRAFVYCPGEEVDKTTTARYVEASCSQSGTDESYPGGPLEWSASAGVKATHTRLDVQATTELSRTGGIGGPDAPAGAGPYVRYASNQRA